MDENELLVDDKVTTRKKSRKKQARKSSTVDRVSNQASHRLQDHTPTCRDDPESGNERGTRSSRLTARGRSSTGENNDGGHPSSRTTSEAEAPPTAIETVEPDARIRASYPPAEETSNITSSDHQPGESEMYRISYRIALAWCTRLHERTPDEPLYRRLKVYSINPGLTRSESGIAVCKIPYEPLTPGPSGSVMEVSNRGVGDDTWSVADLEHPHVVMQDGYHPSMSDPRFHQQMVYAVAMQTYDKFRVALGRHVAWTFSRCRGEGDERRNRLLLKPHGAEEPNAWYDPAAGEINFGYFKARQSTPVVQKDVGNVFTSVSHDVIVHETSHALLDGLRAHLMRPSHPDVLAFHEAFADLVAVFQHFTIEGVVQAAIGKCRGKLRDADILVDIAQEFGRSLNGNGHALRTLVDLPEDFANRSADAPSSQPMLCYCDAGTEAHSLGRVLARAVFSAFLVVYEKRTKQYLKLATAGSGELPPGDLCNGLQDILVSEVRNIANQFLCICIRAIDYCPPVDLRFGDYLRALITADYDVVPDDQLGYREALIIAFGQRGIFGEGTSSMTEDALLWGTPDVSLPPVEKLSFSSMEFDGDPAKPVSVLEMRRQAGALGLLVSQPEYAAEFGLVSPRSTEFKTGDYELPLVESVRSARRVGVNKEVNFDTVAEVVQVRHVPLPGGRSFSFFGGSTVILGPRGNVRYIIRKRVDDEVNRMQKQIEFMDKAGSALWNQAGTHMIPRQDLAKMMCTHSG